MDAPGQQLLARPRLAEQEHGRVRRGHLLDLNQHPLDGLALSDDATARARGHVDLLAEVQVLLFQPRLDPVERELGLGGNPLHRVVGVVAARLRSGEKDEPACDRTLAPHHLASRVDDLPEPSLRHRSQAP